MTIASDGAQAPDLFAQGESDLVITDFEMPRIKGDELVEIIRLLAPTQRIIMASSHGYKLRGSLRSEVAMCLDKPFRIDELRTAVKAILKGK